MFLLIVSERHRITEPSVLQLIVILRQRDGGQAGAGRHHKSEGCWDDVIKVTLSLDRDETSIAELPCQEKPHGRTFAISRDMIDYAAVNSNSFVCMGGGEGGCSERKRVSDLIMWTVPRRYARGVVNQH